MELWYFRNNAATKWEQFEREFKKETGIFRMVERKREEVSHFYTAAVGEFQCFDGYALNTDLEWSLAGGVEFDRWPNSTLL